MLNQTQSSQKPADNTSAPAPAEPAKSAPASKSSAAGSAKTDNKTGKKAHLGKTDDSAESDSEADVSDTALTESLPIDDSTEQNANGGKPPTKGTKNKADVVGAAPDPVDAATGVSPLAIGGKDLKSAVPVKEAVAKDSLASAAKVVAADQPSSEPSAANDPKPSSGDSLVGTDPTTPRQSTKGQSGGGKVRAGKAAQADPAAAGGEVNASAAVASATAGGVVDDLTTFEDADTDSPATAAPVASIGHVAAQSVTSLTTENPATPVTSISGGTHSSTASTFALPTGTSQPSAETQFGESNYPQIVSAVHGQLLPDGGSMQLRLDPPELGAVHVNVQMRDGAMTATIEASNDQAARLLSHSLGELKTSLESQGINVEALHVKQSSTTPASRSSSQDSQQQQNSSTDDGSAKREQQRQQMLRRMWQRLSGGDPLDMVA